MDPLPAGVSIRHCLLLDDSPPPQKYTSLAYLHLPWDGYFAGDRFSYRILHCNATLFTAPMYITAFSYARCIKLVGLLDWTFFLPSKWLDWRWPRLYKF